MPESKRRENIKQIQAHQRKYHALGTLLVNHSGPTTDGVINAWDR